MFFALHVYWYTKVATFNAHDGQFILGAESEGKLNQVYTVTILATDGSGNKTLVIGMVTVKK